ncbi:putative membrane protein YkgB [Nocardioides thalensis]|uniref:Putative membrane protein YkgB n=1 Tax=Nocardioides thalensis TaxID=1914755 RepID=A0A853CBV2_9ACTN|nr:DoxX family protein [Nocardioides thalensis]NYJ03653.1 putative membrane protein YkgB [Nocardioides thalensis]
MSTTIENPAATNGSRRVPEGAPPLLDAVRRRLTGVGLPALRISLGVVIAAFGSLKFFPGASPAEGLVMRTTEVLTLGLVDGRPAVLATAAIELALGIVLLTGRFLKPGLVLMAGWLAGILSPVLLFPGEMFPGGLPTLAAQYVLKDVILAAAWLVLVAECLGARLVTPEPTD